MKCFKVLIIVLFFWKNFDIIFNRWYIMDKFKKVMAGILATLIASGLVSGCKSNRNASADLKENKTYTLELPIKDNLMNIGDNGEVDVSFIGKVLNIIDRTEADINYEALNRLLQTIDEEEVFYYPADIYNIDFDKVNLKDGKWHIVITSSCRDWDNIKYVIENSCDITISINSFSESDVADLLDIIKLVSDRHGTIMLNTWLVSDEGTCKLLEGLDPTWSFARFSLATQKDVGLYLRNITADTIAVDLSFCENLSDITLSDKVENLYIDAYKKGVGLFEVHVNLPDSINYISVGHDYIDSLVLDNIGYANLQIRTTKEEKLEDFINLGYFDGERFRISVGDYVLEKNVFTDGKIVLYVAGVELGEVQIDREEAKIKLVTKEENWQRRRVRKENGKN